MSKSYEAIRVALVMAGVPHQVSRLVGSDAVSFLRRATLVSLGRIENPDIEDALRQTVADGGKSIGKQSLAACSAAIGGFPYMMQLLEQGVIEQDAYRRLGFSLPGFAKFAARME